MYKSLQAGRAIAAILVVLFHLSAAISLEKYFGIKEFSIPFSFGYSGVDFFFVLSGFIIFHAHKSDFGQPGKLVPYLYKRVTRVYPVYLIVFIGVYVLAIISPQLRNSVPHDVLLVVKSMLLLPQDKSLVGGTGAPVLIVAWTLQFEMLFYLVFSLAIVNKRLGVAAILLFILLSLYRLVGQEYEFPLNFIASEYVWLFLMGMLVAKFTTLTRGGLGLAKVLAVFGGAIYFIVSLGVIMELDEFSEFNRTIVYGVGCSFIVAALVVFENNGKTFLGHKTFQLLGASSYSLYLIHFPLISILLKLAMIAGLASLGFFGAVLSFVLILMVCIFTSIAFHLVVERPVSEKLKSVMVYRVEKI